MTTLDSSSFASSAGDAVQPERAANPSGPTPLSVQWVRRLCLRASRAWLVLTGGLIVLLAIRAPIAHRPEFDQGLIKQFIYWFNPLSENTIPAWFSGILLWTCAWLLFLVAILNRAAARPRTRQWFLLGLVFTFLCADELLSFHERLSEPMHGIVGSTGIFYKAWVFPAFIILAALGGYYLSFLIQLERTVRRWVILAAVLYVGGAAVLEMIGGMFHGENGSLANSRIYHLINYTEEVCEMLGAVVFIHALHLQIVVLYSKLAEAGKIAQRDDLCESSLREAA